MPFVFTWTIPNKQIEFSCVAEDIGEAQRKSIDVIKKMEDISYETVSLTEKRTKMIKEIHSAPDDEEKSTFSPPSKNILRKRIFEITKEIEDLRSLVDANIYIGMTSLTDFKYTSSGNDSEMSLFQLIIKTEPTINEYHPITIKRLNVGF